MYNYCITYKVSEDDYRPGLMNMRGANIKEVESAFYKAFPTYILIDIV
ncbi:hypothetical protein [Maribacter sp. Hel_I_7]|nr:hypothetical protein [Maribacter sp. Hel_I_7]